MRWDDHQDDDKYSKMERTNRGRYYTVVTVSTVIVVGYLWSTLAGTASEDDALHDYKTVGEQLPLADVGVSERPPPLTTDQVEKLRCGETRRKRTGYMWDQNDWNRLARYYLTSTQDLHGAGDDIGGPLIRYEVEHAAGHSRVYANQSVQADQPVWAFGSNVAQFDAMESVLQFLSLVPEHQRCLVLEWAIPAPCNKDVTRECLTLVLDDSSLMAHTHHFHHSNRFQSSLISERSEERCRGRSWCLTSIIPLEPGDEMTQNSYMQSGLPGEEVTEPSKWIFELLDAVGLHELPDIRRHGLAEMDDYWSDE